ncbi:GNAT family N-acetyltransferase [Agrococcus jejuensis]|nr:GNAT family N-acetyltransferase [Agrococcus jejuensis]
MSESPEVEIVDAAEQGRFELRVGGELVSFVDYADHDGRRAFPHTQTYPEFGGRGYGTQVVRAALDEAVAAGRSVVPSCPFVRAVVQQHPAEYGALVA